VQDQEQDQPTPKEVDLGNVSYVIFDWDGVIVDSMPEYIKTFSFLLKGEFDIPEEVSEEFFTGVAGGKPLGYQIREAVRQFAGKQVDDTEVFEVMFWEMLKDQSPELMSGVREVLKELRRKGIFIASWSGSPGDINRNVAKKIGIYDMFDIITGSETESNIKVKGPGLFKDIAKHFNKAPDELASQSLIIGDMAGDIEAGKEIGAITVGFGDPNDPKFKDADFVVKSHQELLDMLNS